MVKKMEDQRAREYGERGIDCQRASARYVLYFAFETRRGWFLQDTALLIAPLLSTTQSNTQRNTPPQVSSRRGGAIRGHVPSWPTVRSSLPAAREGVGAHTLTEIPHSVIKLHFICQTVVHSHHSLSPFSPFTGAIHCAFLFMAQVILKVVLLDQGAFVGVITLHT